LWVYADLKVRMNTPTSGMIGYGSFDKKIAYLNQFLISGHGLENRAGELNARMQFGLCGSAPCDFRTLPECHDTTIQPAKFYLMPEASNVCNR
jgi:hypothetical protein